MEKGQVNLPIEEYNNLLLQNTMLKRAISLKLGWNDETVSVEFNPAVIDEYIAALFNDSKFSGKYAMTPTEYWMTATAHIANENPVALVPTDEPNTNELDVPR